MKQLHLKTLYSLWTKLRSVFKKNAPEIEGGKLMIYENIQYQTILADPPWYQRGGGKSKRGADRLYPIMKESEI